MGKHQSKLKSDVLEDLRSVTQFNDAEITEWHNNFLKDFPTGVLTIEEFKMMYGKIFPRWDASLFAEHVFRSFDSNGDGSIDFRDFLCVISITSKVKMEDKLEWAFNMYDMDRDGFITRGDMLDIVWSLPRCGEAEVDEATPDKKMEKILGHMDGDKDLELSSRGLC
eukprot:GFUD01139932.1.p2 GENE.GFUD01139932.1~~GFUD01139932.1.p2  ORF type:complete len:167 (-),score=49.45 GFUD01139932.1:60-560(-)